MTTWVLIVMMYYNRAGFTAEFTSKEKCEAAGQAVVDMGGEGLGGKTFDKYTCVEK